MQSFIKKNQLKNKKIVIICTSSFGIRFRDFFVNSTGLDAECYYFKDSYLEKESLQACIRDFNNDPEVDLITTMPIMGIEHWIRQEKFFRSIPSDRHEVLEKEKFLMNTNKIITRLEQMEK